MKKRALILALAGIMAASLIGCGSRKDDAVVVKNITEAVQALFEIDTHKIRIMKGGRVK
jgi:hypothetical protein